MALNKPSMVISRTSVEETSYEGTSAVIKNFPNREGDQKNGSVYTTEDKYALYGLQPDCSLARGGGNGFACLWFKCNEYVLANLKGELEHTCREEIRSLPSNSGSERVSRQVCELWRISKFSQ